MVYSPIFLRESVRPSSITSTPSSGKDAVRGQPGVDIERDGHLSHALHPFVSAFME
jgi:hypothetical protein